MARAGSGRGGDPHYELTEADDVREAYEAALRPRRFDDPDRVHVVMGVYTTDLSEGRGDIYVACGLGRQLEKLGYEIVYLHRDQWYDPPDGTDIFISMLAERTVMLDPLRLDPSIARLAWARNNTQRWVRHPHTATYDAVLASSELALREISRVYPGPTGLLSIGVDDELFTLDGPGADQGRSGVVSTVNQWGGERQIYGALRRFEIDFPLAIYGRQKGLARELRAHENEALPYFALPSLYRQCALVLDDQQDVNRGYGSVNSRIYESLACGVLPITNTTLGLNDVGLDKVPSYATPDELRQAIRGLLDEEPTRQQLVEELREVVLERHTYRQRAAVLDDFLTETGLKEGRRPATFPIVGFVPDYRVTNPYQDMLYHALNDHGMAAVPVPSFDRIGETSRLLGDRLTLHVHWTAPVLGPADSHEDAEVAARRFVGDLDAVAMRGGRLVWTVHNLLPHDADHLDVEAAMRQQLAERADAVHVMCERTVDLAAQHYRIPEHTVHVIAHASYVDVYPNLVGREHARHELGLAADDTVVLFFGQVRPYKGIEDLLDAFSEVRRDRSGLVLLIAGNPSKDAGVKELVERIRGTEGVRSKLEIIPDEDLQTYVTAADLVALPYRAGLNSGALHLAMSYGRPVVAAAIGCLPSSLTEETGVTYDPDGGGLADALAGAIERFTGRNRQEAEAACLAAARAHTYRDMAEQFARMVADITGWTGPDGGSADGDDPGDQNR